MTAFLRRSFTDFRRIDGGAQARSELSSLRFIRILSSASLRVIALDKTFAHVFAHPDVKKKKIHTYLDNGASAFDAILRFLYEIPR